MMVCEKQFLPIDVCAVHVTRLIRGFVDGSNGDLVAFHAWIARAEQSATRHIQLIASGDQILVGTWQGPATTHHYPVEVILATFNVIIGVSLNHILVLCVLC